MTKENNHSDSPIYIVTVSYCCMIMITHYHGWSFYVSRYHVKPNNITYMAGGPGEVLSRGALKVLVEKALRTNNTKKYKVCHITTGGKNIDLLPSGSEHHEVLQFGSI